MPGKGSIAYPKPLPLAIERHQRKAAKQQALEDAYADVDKRDQGLCRATGAYTIPGAPDARQRREHHHLFGRWVRPDLRASADHIITVRSDVHQLITAGALIVEGRDARKRIVFHWNRLLIASGKEPFKLLSKRRSQNGRIGGE